MAYVTEYGNYGQDTALHFDAAALTPEQWEHLDNATDAERLPYVLAILNGQDLSRWEQ